MLRHGDPDGFYGAVFDGMCAACVTYRAVYCLSGTDQTDGTCVPSADECYDANINFLDTIEYFRGCSTVNAVDYSNQQDYGSLISIAINDDLITSQSLPQVLWNLSVPTNSY